MLEEKLARVRKLMEQREKIDAELAGMLGMSTAPKRGRPRKEQGAVEDNKTAGEGISAGLPKAQSTGTGLSDE